MSFCYALHYLHSEHILIYRNVYRRIDGGHFVLGRRNLVVLGLTCHSQTPQLAVKLAHKCGNPVAYRAVIVVFEFLTLGRRRTEESSSAQAQILAL